MAMHCGPTRHHIKTAAGWALHRLDLVVHDTNHEPDGTDELHIQEVFRGLVEDDERTGRICDDIAVAVAKGRNCLVLTRWKDHLERIVEGLRWRGQDPLVLHGGMGKKARAAVVKQLGRKSSDGGLLLAATASLVGEGFDCPVLDTLFLAFPIRFKGSVVQYVGRVLRPTDTKHTIEVHDYVDRNVAVIARMHAERLTAYASLGFDIPDPRQGSRRRAR
jgi:DNA or RNA helicases of superfamily II